jgi:hypothetical protein
LKVDFLEIRFNFVKENLMNHNLLHVSAVALQKSLEKQAQTGSYIAQDDLESIPEEERPSTIFSRLSDLLHNRKTAHPHWLCQS